jgi:hypothetical protein
MWPKGNTQAGAKFPEMQSEYSQQKFIKRLNFLILKRRAIALGIQRFGAA